MRWAQSRQLLVVCKSPGARPRKSHGFTGGRRVTGAESVLLSFVGRKSGGGVGLRRAGVGAEKFVLLGERGKAGYLCSAAGGPGVA
jgi:hypothetical protein